MRLCTNRKEQQSSSGLCSEDCRVLLLASLTLLLAQCRHGQPILQGDLVRLISLADVAIARPTPKNPDAKSFKMENRGERALSPSAEAGAK